MRVQIEDEWEGWEGETIVSLTDGTYWRQIEYHYEYFYAYRPMGSLTNGRLHIDGMSMPIGVSQFFPIISRVVGEWTGWDGETRVELANGQVWEQASYHYEYRYAYRPQVMIDGDRMLVQGMKKAIRVRRA